MPPLRWTTKSTRTLSAQLRADGHPAGATAVAELLRRLGYRLQAPGRTAAGRQHPDRDAQFRYLAAQVNAHLQAGQPVVSVDTGKEQLVGRSGHRRRERQPRGQPAAVTVRDCMGEPGKAIPFGVDDVGASTAWSPAAPWTVAAGRWNATRPSSS